MSVKKNVPSPVSEHVFGTNEKGESVRCQDARLSMGWVSCALVCSKRPGHVVLRRPGWQLASMGVLAKSTASQHPERG